MSAQDDQINQEGDLMATYYLDEPLRKEYIIWIKIHQIFNGSILIAVFNPLIDIVPSMVYYHAAKNLEALKWETQELINESSSSDKSNSVYGLWFRFETLAAMVKRADNVFGSIVIINKGVLFFNICGVVYIVFKLMKAPPSNQESHLMNVLFYVLNNLLLYFCRLLFTISFMSKLSTTSDDLISTVAY